MAGEAKYMIRFSRLRRVSRGRRYRLAVFWRRFMQTDVQVSKMHGQLPEQNTHENVPPKGPNAR